MKKVFLLAICLASVNGLLAQSSQQQKIDSVCKLVQQYFNEKSDSELYQLTGESFRKELSPAAFKNVFNNNLLPLGKMTKADFEFLEDGVARYKARFSLLNLSLLLSLDKKDKIETFLFKPYVNEKAKKNYRVPTSNPLVSALDKEVDSAVQSYISREASVGLSIGILKDGNTFFYSYGETAKGNKQLPTEHTLFEIGSLSKTFTAILLADAVISRKVRLDDPASQYLPDSIPPLAFEGVPVTLQTLANHTSGIPRMPSNFFPVNFGNPYRDYDDKLLFSFYKNFKPTRKPGETYEYSNLAVGTLGVILERINHQDYETLFMRTICQPLHMVETKEYLQPKDSVNFAKGYNDLGVFNSQWDFKALAACGSIRSTCSDLLIYARANLGDAPKKLDRAIKLTHTVTFTQGDTKVGLAWHYIHPGKDEVLFHNGGTGGYHSYLGVNLRKKFAVVILSNTAISADDNGNELMKWLETN